MLVKVAGMTALGNCRLPTYGLAGAMPAALLLLKTGRSPASCSIYPTNICPSGQAAWDDAVSEGQIFRQRKYTELRESAAKYSQGWGVEKFLKLIFRVFCLKSEGSTASLHLLEKGKSGITFYPQKKKNMCMGSFINNNRTAYTKELETLMACWGSN